MSFPFSFFLSFFEPLKVAYDKSVYVRIRCAACLDNCPADCTVARGADLAREPINKMRRDALMTSVAAVDRGVSGGTTTTIGNKRRITNK